MKHFYKISLSVIAIATYIFLTSGIDRSTGSPGGKTGSPGDNGSTCTQCHSGSPTQADDLITSNIPGNGFTPGETYTITAELSNDEAELMGFELTAEDNQGNKMGEFTLINAAETQLVNNDGAVTHTSDGIEPTGGTKSWSFEWTAPSNPSSDVTFYAAFNAANGNGTTSGDEIFTSERNAVINSVGINENTLQARIYPNPASEFLKIEYPHSVERKLQVIDMRGAVVKSFVITGSQLNLSVSGWEKGIYFLRNEKGGMKRFVVN